MKKKNFAVIKSGVSTIFQLLASLPISRVQVTNYKEKVEILKVVGRSKSGRHYTVETNVGTLRKPAGSIPKRLLREFDGRS